MLAAIQAGGKLKTVEAAEGSSRSFDSRGQLLDAIRQGASLKPVDQDESDRRSSDMEPAADQDGLVGALARALASRRPACVDSDDDESSDDEDEDDDDEEWDD